MKKEARIMGGRAAFYFLHAPSPIAACLSLLVLVAGGCAAGPRRFEYDEPHMGTRFRIVLYADGPERADAAAREAFGRIAELEGRLSDYDPASELSRLSGGTGWRGVSDDLWRNLVLGGEIWRESGGAFDPTVGGLSRLWRRAHRRGELPEPARLEEALEGTGFDKVELDAATRSVRFAVSGVRLDLGGIAKGDALDEALTVLALHGIERALVDGGGDIRAGVPPPGEPGWTVLLPGAGDVNETLALSHGAVATSGDTERFLVHEGRRYSHIVDPRTGYALVDSPVVTVLAPSGALADAWASALSVSGEAGLVAARRNGIEARLFLRDGVRLRKRETAGFGERLSSKEEASLRSTPARGRP